MKGEGLFKLAEEQVMIFSTNFIRYGILADFNEEVIRLEKPAMVYSTGPFDLPDYKNRQEMPGEFGLVHRRSVESIVFAKESVRASLKRPKDSKKLEEEEPKSRFSLLNTMSMIYALNYIYHGTPIDQDEITIELDEPSIIYNTGPHKKRAYGRKERLPGPFALIMKDAIEAQHVAQDSKYTRWANA